jgi:malonyl CoA-acyl carrier protein transacylase
MAEAASIPGAMSALALPVETVRDLLARLAPRVVVANHNGPAQVVVSGPADAVEDLEVKLAAEGITARRLPVATAFHSGVVAASCEPFAQFLAGVAFEPPRIPVYSNATAAPHAGEVDALRAALAAQIASPVRFVEMVEAMYGAGARTFVEVGPASVLTGLVGAILDGKPHAAVSLDRKGKGGVESLLLGLARLVAAGVPMEPAHLFEEYRESAAVAGSPAPKLAVAICGSNHGKVYPPPGGARDLPAPNPPRPVAAPVEEPVTTKAETAMPLHVPLPAPAQVSAPAPAPVPSAGPVPAAGPSAWVLAFQESQRQTAEAHSVFQRAMAESHAAYLRVAEAGFAGLSAMGHGLSAGAPQAWPTLAGPTAPRAVEAVPEVAPAVAAPGVPVAVAPRVAEPVAPRPEPAAAAVAPPAGARPAATVDLHALMLAVVAEKTGYPADMLNLGMDLEGDLGVDSIKRVEILSAVQEQAPGLPKVDMAHMAALRTLGAIVDYMRGLSGPAEAASGIAIATAAGAPVSATVDLHALMLAVVAEKTGYPADMLNLGMDLEGDLGIDSIKRVEILSAVQEQAPGLPKVDMAHMAALRTLGAIVDYMRGLAGQTPDAPAAATLPASVAASASPRAETAAAEKPREAAGAAPRPAPLGRFVLERIEAPAAGLAQPGLLGGGEVWITGGGALDEALAAELQRRGVDARATAAVPDGATAVVYLGGLRDVRDLDGAIAVNREAFRVARDLARTLESGRGLFVTAQDTGAAFGMEAMDGRRAWLSGLPALVKTASQEWPRASVKAIDVERGGRDADEIARALAEELLHGGGEIEVALPASGGRFTLRSVRRNVEPGEPAIGRGDVVVVSGGARGVTSACLAEWARDSGARFVLLGRTALAEEPDCCAAAADEAALKKALLAAARAAGESPAPAELGARVRDVLANREIRSTLAALEAAGSPARYEAVNVSDARELSLVLARVRDEWGPIAGVVHAAGVLADRKISAKTDEQFDRVFGTKVEGLRALLAATENDPLKLLCVFSSVSARCGNTGQADYAMANEVLAKVAWAESRRRPGLLVKSLGWGPWEAGMVTPQLKERFASLGVPIIPLVRGARMFADEVRGAGRSEVELVLGGEPRAEALLVAGADARVDELELKVARRSHGYLAGHAINGTPVVPVVLAAEWFARAARGFRPGYSLAALHDLKVLKGIRLGGFDNGGDRFVIEARPLPGNGGPQLQLDVRGPGGTHHYSARAELSAEPATPGEDSPHLPLEAWEAKPIYDDLLFHREAFELIEEMDGISDHGAGGRVRGVSRAGWENGPWQLDAAALDAGLQVAVLYGHRMLGGPSLPTTIGRLRAFQAPGEGLLTATAHRRKVGSLSVTTDVLLSDDEGRPVAELTGVETHTYPRGNGKA